MRRPHHWANGTPLFLLSGYVALLASPITSFANQPPVIADITLSPEASLTDVTFEVHCSATDPEGDTLSFDWEPQAGTLVGAGAHGPSVEWTLPSVAGQYMLTIRVNDGQGNVVTADRMVPLGPLRFYETLSTPTRVPTRVVAAPDGTLWMTDSSLGRVIHLNAGGVTLGEFDTSPRPLGIAVEDSGSILVGEDGLDRVARYSPSGQLLGTIGPSALRMPNAIQMDRSSGKIYVLDSERSCVDVFTSGGVLSSTIGSSSVLGYPIDMALNAEAGELFIADQTNNRIEVYSLAGQWLRRFGTAGFGPGQFTRIQGITLESDGQLAVLDSVYCRLQLLTPQGVPLATIGHLGTWSGAMRAPLGVAAVPGERLFVTSSGTNDIRVFSHWDWNPTGPQGTVVGFMIR